MPESLVGALTHDGYAVVEGVLDGAQVDVARAALGPLLEAAPFGANSFVGRRTKRVFGLPGKTRALDGLLVHPVVLDALDRVLGDYLLSSSVAVEIHPGEPAQTLHTDAGAWPVPPGGGQILVNAIWALDAFTEPNGGTRIAPGSHLGDDPPPPDVATEVVAMPTGSVLLYVGTLWHGGGANDTDQSRLGLVTGYVAAWLRPQENYALTCPPDVARATPPRLRELLGYSLYPPFVGHVDGQDPRGLLTQ